MSEGATPVEAVATVAKKAPKKAPAAKKATKKVEKAERNKPVSDALQAEILKFMRKGKEYTSREIVVGVGRKPGSAGGGPVVRILKELVKAKQVAYASAEGKKGMCWTKK